MSYHIPQVKYYEYKEDGTKSSLMAWACFANVVRSHREDMPAKVEYFCPIDPRIKQDCLKFYLEFLGKFLDSSIYSFIINDDNTKVTFMLNCKGLTKMQTLLYLTSFHYPDEFPEIVELLFKGSSNKSDEELFLLFRKLHQDYYENKVGVKKYDAIIGHGLARTYLYGKITVDVNLEQFKENLKKSLTKVSEYFILNPTVKQ